MKFRHSCPDLHIKESLVLLQTIARPLGHFQLAHQNAHIQAAVLFNVSLNARVMANEADSFRMNLYTLNIRQRGQTYHLLASSSVQ